MEPGVHLGSLDRVTRHSITVLVPFYLDGELLIELGVPPG
jgi:hypothetical protein